MKIFELISNKIPFFRKNYQEHSGKKSVHQLLKLGQDFKDYLNKVLFSNMYNKGV